jgi:hypothetical protein
MTLVVAGFIGFVIGMGFVPFIDWLIYRIQPRRDLEG